MLSAEGGVVAIKGDGQCCYHLAGVIGCLCKNSDVLLCGRARCSNSDLSRARQQITENFQDGQIRQRIRLALLRVIH